MSLLVKGGITKLSELDIDAAPGKAEDIAELILTTQGDVLYRNAVAARLAASYGVGYNFIHALNTGIDKPEWLDIQDIIAFMTGAVNRMIAPPTLVIPVPDLNLVVAEDHSGGGFTATPSLTIPTPTIDKAAVKSDPAAVGGGVAHDDDGADTDETAETNSAAANDMHLLPDPGAVGDGFYFGLANPFDWMCLNIGTPGVGTWTITWKYWNGVTWTALTLIGLKDQTGNFRAAAGKHWVTFERPGDWALKVISAMNLYWIKGECTAYTNMTTQPLGTQAWTGRYT